MMHKYYFVIDRTASTAVQINHYDASIHVYQIKIWQVEWEPGYS